MTRPKSSLLASTIAGFILFHITGGTVDAYSDKLACEQARELVDLNERRYACIPNNREIQKLRDDGKLDYPSR